MRLARQLHLYFGVFFAPTFIFFAFSGMLQTFSLHEGKNPQPWIVAIEQVHTHQRMPGPLGAPAAAPATSTASPTPATSAPATSAPSTSVGAVPATATPATPPPPRRKRSLPMRIFVAFMGVGLIGSSLVGVWMGFQLRQPAFIWTLLIAGTIIPFAALYIGTRP